MEGANGMERKTMVRCALCAAWITVSAWLSIPVGEIAITMQTFGIFFTLGILGGKKGTVACGLYLLLGAVGLPVFSGFQGGISALLGPTGGYLWGFLLSCLIFWLLENRVPAWVNMIIAMLGCYLCGSVWFYGVYTEGGVGFVLLRCVLPYLLPDAVKIYLAGMLSKRLKGKA